MKVITKTDTELVMLVTAQEARSAELMAEHVLLNGLEVLPYDEQHDNILLVAVKEGMNVRSAYQPLEEGKTLPQEIAELLKVAD